MWMNVLHLDSYKDAGVLADLDDAIKVGENLEYGRKLPGSSCMTVTHRRKTLRNSKRF